ncbi:hypothetical protein JCM21900_005601 [Sporobolomyces salmonicolor]
MPVPPMSIELPDKALKHHATYLLTPEPNADLAHSCPVSETSRTFRSLATSSSSVTLLLRLTPASWPTTRGVEGGTMSRRGVAVDDDLNSGEEGEEVWWWMDENGLVSGALRSLSLTSGSTSLAHPSSAVFPKSNSRFTSLVPLENQGKPASLAYASSTHKLADVASASRLNPPEEKLRLLSACQRETTRIDSTKVSSTPRGLQS